LNLFSVIKQTQNSQRDWQLLECRNFDTVVMLSGLQFALQYANLKI